MVIIYFAVKCCTGRISLKSAQRDERETREGKRGESEQRRWEADRKCDGLWWEGEKDAEMEGDGEDRAVDGEEEEESCLSAESDPWIKTCRPPLITLWDTLRQNWGRCDAQNPSQTPEN